MWGTIRYEHELHVGNTKWEDRIQCGVQQLGNIYIVKYGDRKSGNFGIIKYGNEGERKEQPAQSLVSVDWRWCGRQDLLGRLFVEVIAASQVAMSQG